MKIGFMLCAFNQEEFLDGCLQDLVPFCKEYGHIISAVSVPFLEYKDKGIKYDGTTSILKGKLKNGDIDYLVSDPKYITDAEARNFALKPLLENDCDLIFLIDSDEKFSKLDLENIINYVENSEFIDWWAISYKNYVGNGYLIEPFTPPRIFKVNARGLKASHFYFDNDLLYISKDGSELNYKSLSNKVIPQSIAWVPHFTWTNTERNKLKIEYQNVHNHGCSYKWEDGEVKLNDDFYHRNNLIKPNIVYED